MAIRDFGAALRRHPLVTAVAVVLTALAVLRVQTAPMRYEARTVVTFLSPQSPFPRNSFASFTPSLVTMAEVSSRWLDSSAGRRAVRSAGGTEAFQVLLANRGNQEQPIHDQPYLTLSVTAGTPAKARGTLLKVLAVLRERLRRQQAVQGARPGSYISWQVAAGSDRAVPVLGRPSRALLAVLLIGGIGGTYAAVTADRRRNRKSAAAPA
ncbi:hypothetical protein AGRA3207_002398 [Actinomadura graeca]|uniref:Polysaccharide chain length determinant N-terminal domain-containing protein n=1 Tax=Actinomadura graeca TaxID=2750812 RepID=A0ABX8QVR8_9ACTN|nr:hypothetical protein [Actinomadura graeca]QXJ21537.1 hypothetical protein AGRA3207_002398 [Actinomadura graeca]